MEWRDGEVRDGQAGGGLTEMKNERERKKLIYRWWRHNDASDDDDEVNCW
jgi:hypothetical protein